MHLATLLSLIVASAVSIHAAEPCRIEVVEKGTGWPVPLVELKTLHNIRYVSDNNGLIACDAPELMGVQTWFDVAGHGYEVRKDGFGFSGVKLTPSPGKTLRVEVERKIIAKRLGRITGAGLFAESQKLGQERKWRESGILGCDSVQNSVYGGRMFWAWGDTTVPNYPFGIFHSSSAVSVVRPLSRFEPPVKLQLQYFTNENGRPRDVARMPGDGPTWLSAYVTLRDRYGKERLVASYFKITPPLECYEIGLCVWNDGSESFDRHRVLWKKSEGKEKPLLPEGHPAFWKDTNGMEWVLFGNPLPSMRCPATFEAWQDPTKWERVSPPDAFKSADGDLVKPHGGHMAWNNFRKRWVTVFLQTFGKPSAFGELWYTEAREPFGPWGPAVKILTHQNYTFYNPRLHPEFTEPNSPILLFEGTYTSEFADRPFPTARYNYNQVLYRLDLDDEALKPAMVRD